MVSVICDFCENEFNKKPSLVKENNFCDRSCMGKWKSENVSGENHHQYKRITVECKTCGKEKEVTPSHHKKVNNHYCGPECQAENEDRSKRQKKDKIIVECDYCDYELERYPWRVERDGNNFCNRNCKGKFKTENRSGKNSPFFEHGGVNYGTDWPKMRSQIQERDENECQKCGKSEKEIGQKPDVHHIVPVKSYDNPNEAHKMSNMVQLCRSCHRTMEELNKQQQLTELRNA